MPKSSLTDIPNNDDDTDICLSLQWIISLHLIRAAGDLLFLIMLPRVGVLRA